MLTSKELPFAHGRVDRVKDGWVGVAQDHGTLAQHIIDVAVAVDIVDHGTLGTIKKEGRLGEQTHIAADTTGERFLGAFQQFLRARPL